MTVLTDTQVVTASGGLVELGYLALTSAVAVTSTSGQNVGGSVTAVCDGSPIIVEMFCPYSVIGNYYLVSSLYVDGSFQQRVGVQVNQTSPFYAKVRLTPSAGSHTFQWSALVNASSGTFQFDPAPTTNGGPGFLRVSKIVTATQWPAATTGTIICTSSTRPASPFAGQQIYETDTSLSYSYSGSAWVKNVQQTVTGAAVTTNVWQTPTLAGTWANYGGGYQGARYIKDDTGTVFIEGLVRTGTGTVFTLAAGYRPLNTLIFAVIADNTIARLDVAAAGTVTWNTGGSNSYVSLLCSFKASQ